MPPPPPPPPPGSNKDPKKPDQSPSMKKVNWDKITPHELTDDCFWKKREDNAIPDKIVVEGLKKRFSLPPAKNVLKKTAVKPLLVMNQRDAQNLLIIKQGQLKDTSYEDIRKYILNCSGSMLKNDFIVGLIKCWPQPFYLKKLIELKETSLADPEHFIASLCDIERLVPRLNCIQTAMHFNESAANLNHSINVATAASNEIFKAQKFRDVLIVIRTVGNIMNSGSNCGKAIAFALPILTKLHEIKSTDNTQTLLDFVTETITRDRSDLLNFVHEMDHIDEASGLNIDFIENELKKLGDEVKLIKEEVENNKIKRLDDDKFLQVMTPCMVQYSSELTRLKDNLNKLMECYENVAKVFGFKSNEFRMKECFLTISSFIKRFTSAKLKMTGTGIEQVENNENVPPNVSTCKSPGKTANIKISIIDPIAEGIQARIDFCRNRCCEVKLKRFTQKGKHSSKNQLFFTGLYKVFFWVFIQFQKLLQYVEQIKR